jgi:uncharacterized protein (DUF2235 family)
MTNAKHHDIEARRIRVDMDSRSAPLKNDDFSDPGHEHTGSTIPSNLPTCFLTPPVIPRPDAKRLVLFFDGTGNDIQSDTNVYRLYLNLAPWDAKSGWRQLAFYSPGVGTLRGESIRGSAFGYFTGRNLRNGYQWLRQHYREGDEIYVFGFSRGAYAALGFVGFLAWCGLLRPDAPMSIAHLFDRYNKAAGAAQEEGENSKAQLDEKEQEVLSRDQLQKKKDAGMALSPQSELILDYGRRVPVRFVGVFDTVRSIGFEAIVPSKFREEYLPHTGLKLWFPASVKWLETK